MNAINYQKELEKILSRIDKSNRPKLLMHSCCAPCSSYCLTYLKDYFKITTLFYNPNISSEEEYRKREAELKRLILAINEEYSSDILMMDCDYNPQEFLILAEGLENAPEGGARCFLCYEQRLRETAIRASQGDYDYFVTTLSISPLKNSTKLNEIGIQLASEYGVKYLLSDFKKKDGYKQSIELSKKYDLYRQNYCGCVYSKRES